MAETRKVRLGFVGVGGMGQCAHLRNYVTLPDCEVVALAELRRTMGEAVARRYNVPRCYGSHAEMLAAEKLDGIVASQPFGRHGVLLKDLVKAGVPIFIEKPLAHSVAVGEAILKAFAGTGARLMVGYHKRSDPATRFVKAEIERLTASGEIGKMRYVRILMPAGDWVANGFTDLIGAPAGEGYPKVEWDPPAPDMDAELFKQYGVFVNYYIHQVNLMRHLLGEPYRVTYADPAGVLLVGQSRSGVTCTIEMSPYQTTLDWQESALVAFEHGYLRLGLPAPLASNRPGDVEMFKDVKGAAPASIRPQLPWIHAMRQQAMNFVAFVRGDAPPPCDGVEALEDLKVAREYIRLKSGR